MSALTLRDCRRLMSRGKWLMDSEAQFIVRRIGWGDEALSTLDRLISKHGPNAFAADILQPKDDWIEENRADRTNHKVGEDAPISDGAHTNPDADTHGGDGNSGECDHAAEKAAENRAGSDSACKAGATGDTPSGHEDGAVGADVSDDGTPGPAHSSADAGQPTGRGDSGADEVTEGMGSHTIDRSSSSADKEPVGTRCPATGDEEAGDGSWSEPEAAGDAGAPEADSQSASGSSRRHGDCSGEGGGALKVSPLLARVTQVARIARALSRLMADATRPEPSPLWDGKRVVRELVSRQVRLHRMRRDVPAVKGLLVLYDVSGSCAWIADRTFGIAEALAKRYSRLFAAPTPSPFGGEGSLDPTQIIGRDVKRFAKLPPILGYGYGDDVTGWRRLKAAGISHILVFGDAHGTAGYQAAAEAGIRVLWANPNPNIAPDATDWCDYTLISDDDIAAAVEKLASKGTKK